MRITVTNLQTGEVADITRAWSDLAVAVPQWVLDQLGCSRRSELGEFIDQVMREGSVDDWYYDGEHVGADPFGLAVYRDEPANA